jgi:hypothetical protein
MKKKYIIYQQGGKTKKAVLDENMLKIYKNNPEISSIEEFENETLMEKTYGEQTSNKKILLG